MVERILFQCEKWGRMKEFDWLKSTESQPNVRLLRQNVERKEFQILVHYLGGI